MFSAASCAERTGVSHRAGDFKPQFRGQVVQNARALIPGIHAQKQDEQNAREEEKTPQCHRRKLLKAGAE